MIFLETERLLLRRLTQLDVDNLFELDSDPEVMRYIGKPTPFEVIRDEFLPTVMAEYERSDRHGLFAAEVAGRFIGWMSLRLVDDRFDEGDLGYRLRRDAWGQGYATEGSRALIRKAFTELGFQRVFADTMAVNTGSRRVMEGAGLSYVRTFHLHFDDPLPGTELGEVEYAVSKEDWLDS